MKTYHKMCSGPYQYNHKDPYTECGPTPRRSNPDEEHSTLKDSYGDPVLYNMPYYMDPYEFPGERFVYEWTSDGDRGVKLGTSYAKVYLHFWKANGSDSALRINILDREGNPENQYLSKKRGTDEVLLYNHDPLESEWVPENSSDPNFSVGNYFSLQNASDHIISNEKFLSYSIPGEWLTTVQPTMNSKTMWRLIPTWK
ncbi:hypothetical protein [Bacillus toyonensis]|uniref:hypothetical protein n=1 Tax=Bacillus toyonensis TaxID=155322 RepID=UPI000BF95191|nr:hypothetical protein [Bacillus toyonensis]PFY48834.1 hypothetical protein COL54_05925 [Bacillus toyonensis]